MTPGTAWENKPAQCFKKCTHNVSKKKIIAMQEDFERVPNGWIDEIAKTVKSKSSSQTGRKTVKPAPPEVAKQVSTERDLMQLFLNTNIDAVAEKKEEKTELSKAVHAKSKKLRPFAMDVSTYTTAIVEDMEKTKRILPEFINMSHQNVPVNV